MVIPQTKIVENIVDVISIKRVKGKEYKNQLIAKAKNEPIKKRVAFTFPSVGLIRVPAKANIRFISATVK
ncbi:hypothetical protein GCM10007916_05770 [Psychromonas marina]|uniref:Uncharacterized protein n=1 Tax=Psychromonas marina TaxID=88364 RepID=A0ABQ6DWZ0_9GAMM|nr:hypothetical protein GCM10007916_05770 [Psychromonas marina]